MSTASAVSAVTAALRNLLDQGARDNPPGTIVTARPPDRARGPNAGNQLNVFLYQTTMSAAWRNADMPGRVNPGETGVPPLPLTLHYLLTAYGESGENEEDVLAHQVLGRAMSILHDHPILSPAEIGIALGSSEQAIPPVLDQREGIRVTFQPMSLDEMSKLWTTLQTQYRLSVAYQVSVVLIDSARATKVPLPVLRRGEEDRGAEAVPDLTPPFPFLAELATPSGASSAQLGDALVLRGHHLDGDEVEVRFHHAVLDVLRTLPPAAGAGARELTVQLPDDTAAAAWPAGVYTVSVVVRDTSGPDVLERVTNELPVALAPSIRAISPNPVTRDTAGRISVTLTFVPEQRRGQRAALLIGDREVLPEPAHPPPAQTATLDFVASGVAPGDHFARLRLAGVDSILVDRTAVPPVFDENQRISVSE